MQTYGVVKVHSIPIYFVTYQRYDTQFRYEIRCVPFLGIIGELYQEKRNVTKLGLSLHP